MLAVLMGGFLVLGLGRAASRRRRFLALTDQLLAERLLVESHLEQLTVETLQAMRQAARERLRAGR